MTSRIIKCPTCRKAGDWFSGRWGPFCSERCRLIDLGRWLNEEHRILEPLETDGVPAPDLDAGDSESNPGRS